MAERRYPLKRRVFLDSSVLFTAVNSPSGGSAKLFTLKEYELVTSPTVLTEVERNVEKKLLSYHIERFLILVQKITILTQKPKLDLIKKAHKVIVSKDAVILSEAKQSKVPYIATLDRKHFFTDSVKRFLRSQTVVTPKMLLEKIK